MSGFSKEAQTSMLKWRLDENQTYAALFDKDEKEPSAGGYARHRVSFDFSQPGEAKLKGSKISWTNESTLIWEINTIAFFDGPKDGQVIATAGTDPVELKQHEEFELPEINFTLRNKDD